MDNRKFNFQLSFNCFLFSVGDAIIGLYFQLILVGLKYQEDKLIFFKKDNFCHFNRR